MKWLIQQNPNIDLREYFPNSPEYERFELENVNISDIPDLSSYNDLSRVKVTGTNISEIPNPEKFPVEGFMGVVLQNNQITHLDLSGYEKLEDLFFLQLSNNPIRSVDFDSFEEVVRTFDERGGMISISIDGNQLSDEDKNRLKEIISKYNIRVKI